MFAESPLGICRTATGAMLSVNNTAAFSHYMTKCIITVHISSNLIKITIVKFGHLIDDYPIGLTLQLDFLMIMLPVHRLMVDILSHEQVAQNSYGGCESPCSSISKQKLKGSTEIRNAHLMFESIHFKDSI
jgi:hypothetical protein